MKKLLLAAVVLAGCKADNSTLEKKVDDLSKDVREMKAMIAKGGGGAGAQAQQRPGREEAAPDAQFAVDVAQNVKMGMVEGPNAAMVTIVEAWDFA